jgi:hypothetical protein
MGNRKNKIEWEFIKLNRPSPEALKKFNQMICDYITNRMIEEQKQDQIK